MNEKNHDRLSSRKQSFKLAVFGWGSPRVACCPRGLQQFRGSRMQKRRELAAIFDEQIGASNPERQRGLAPLLEMVPSQKRRKAEGGWSDALNAHRWRRVLHTPLDFSLCSVPIVVVRKRRRHSVEKGKLVIPSSVSVPPMRSRVANNTG